VTHVINSRLRKNGTLYLVGDKVSYADLAFIPWQRSYEHFLIPEWDFKDEVPEFAAWRERLMEREAAKRVYAMEEFSIKRAMERGELLGIEQKDFSLTPLE
jgi:glutathione S-transferase